MHRRETLKSEINRMLMNLALYLDEERQMSVSVEALVAALNAVISVKSLS
jgi:hypothetical protein